ncbi:hypothetical protein BST33_15595, partial [Mycolicibacter minnesotensis]
MPPSIPALIDDAETGYDVVADPPAEAERPRRHLRPAPEPGDGLIAVSSAAMAGINAVGLGLAVASRVLRFRRLPSSLQGAVITLDHQPQLRRLLEERIGKRATATALGMATTAVNALAAAPSMLAVDLAINTIRAAEARPGPGVRAGVGSPGGVDGQGLPQPRRRRRGWGGGRGG